MKFLKKESVQKELFSWLLFAVLVVLYVIFIVPYMRENIHMGWKFGVLGLFLGMFMMLVAQILVRAVIFPGIDKFKKHRMLKKIRKDRPNQTIYKVLSFKKNKYGFYDVKVDMEGWFFETKIIHTVNTLPYPLSKYKKLNSQDMGEWLLNNM